MIWLLLIESLNAFKSLFQSAKSMVVKEPDLWDSIYNWLDSKIHFKKLYALFHKSLKVMLPLIVLYLIFQFYFLIVYPFKSNESKVESIGEPIVNDSIYYKVKPFVIKLVLHCYKFLSSI